jgi:hypothetical protein
MKATFRILALLVIAAMVLSACAPAATPEPTMEPEVVEPTNTTSPPTSTPLPPTHTPLPSSCTPSNTTISEVINSLETCANEKNVEGTMELFAENALLEETYQGAYHPVFDGADKIENLWRSYYRDSLPCEFRDINITGNNATFLWAEFKGKYAIQWPVVLEVKDGEIIYLDFYEDSFLELLSNE